MSREEGLEKRLGSRNDTTPHHHHRHAADAADRRQGDQNVRCEAMIVLTVAHSRVLTWRVGRPASRPTCCCPDCTRAEQRLCKRRGGSKALEVHGRGMLGSFSIVITSPLATVCPGSCAAGHAAPPPTSRPG